MADHGPPGGRQVKLVDSAPFRLGAVRVEPARRRLVGAGRTETLEPRVMQALVVLAEAKGEVVSSDELIMRCWDGVVVGENAIQRVISQIRRTASDIGAGSFEVEAIRKVGYRIMESGGERAPDAPGPDRTSAARTSNRRLFLVGSAAAVGTIGAGAYFSLPQTSARDTVAAMALYEKGITIREGGTPMHTEQALAYFREAARLAPDLAQPWGGLAFGYGESTAWSSPADLPALTARTRSAADRALRLDPSNPDARVGLLLMRPLFGNWLETEAIVRRLLQRDPDHRRAIGLLAQVLSDVGRWRDSIPWFDKITGPGHFIAMARVGLIQAIWNAGRLEEAEAALDAAVARWPRHFALWDMRIRFLTYTGRPARALALLQDESAYPTEGAPRLEDRTMIVRAVQSGLASDRRAAADMLLARARLGAGGALVAMEHLSALGALDDAFAIAEGAYFGRGEWARARVPLDRFSGLVTASLFGAITAPMRADARFPALVRAIGLEDYWRRSGTRPDYRIA